MTAPSASPRSNSPGERLEPPAAMPQVEEMLRIVGRAVRAHQMYLHNNPTYLRAMEQVRGAFAPIWS